MVTRVRPYRQGDLDGLCGLYAIVNAMRALCREIDRDTARALFRELGHRLTRRVRQPASVLVDGMDADLLRGLVSDARRFVCDELGVPVAAEDLKVTRGTDLPRLWSALAQNLDGETVAIITTEGRHDHWTVAYAATSRTLRLLDSNGRKTLRQSWCTIAETPTRYWLLPSEIILLRRSFDRQA